MDSHYLEQVPSKGAHEATDMSRSTKRLLLDLRPCAVKAPATQANHFRYLEGQPRPSPPMPHARSLSGLFAFLSHLITDAPRDFLTIHWRFVLFIFHFCILHYFPHQSRRLLRTM